jgi:hypothetical protein
LQGLALAPDVPAARAALVERPDRAVLRSR